VKDDRVGSSNSFFDRIASGLSNMDEDYKDSLL
jgi:hypothetical protein